MLYWPTLIVSKSLLQRSYRDDVPPSYIERFLPLILDMEEENIQVTPCFSDQGINYMHIRHNNLYCRSKLDIADISTCHVDPQFQCSRDHLLPSPSLFRT
jgi:hypothetical protein